MTLKTTLATSLLAFAIVGYFITPAHATDKEQRQMMADIRMLQEQAQQLQNLIGQLNETIATVGKAVNARVDSKIDEQANVTRKAFADQQLVLNGLTVDLRTLREQSADIGVRLGTVEREVTGLRQAVTQLSVARASDDPFGTPDGGTPPPAGSSTESATALYRLADGDYSSGSYETAISGFRAFLKSYPGDKDWADDAQLGICRSYVQLGKDSDAVRECDTLIRTYPSSDRIAEAYYKKGLAHQNLRQTREAEEAFRAAIAKAPGSPEAGQAEMGLKRLQDMKRP